MEVLRLKSTLLALIFLIGSSFEELTISKDICQIPENLDIIVVSESERPRDFGAIDSILHRGNVAIVKGRLPDWHAWNKTLEFFRGQMLNIIFPSNTSSFIHAFGQIAALLNQPNITHLRWAPKILLIWPKVYKSRQEAKSLVKSHIFDPCTEKLDLRNEVYIVVPYISEIPGQNQSNGKVELSFWETYTISNISIVQELKFISEISRGRVSKESGNDNGVAVWCLLESRVARRSNFHGAKISATGSSNPLFYAETRYANNSVPKFISGSAVSRFRFIERGLNFTEQAVWGKYTSEDKNMQLTGSGVQVMQGLIDISIAQTPMTGSKRRQIEFLQPTDEKVLKAFFVQPASGNRDLYIASFEPTLWLTMLVVWFILVMAMIVFVWVESTIRPFRVHEDIWIIRDSWIWAIGTMAQKSWHIIPKSSSIRILYLFGHIMGLLCFVAISASIVSFLSTKTIPIKSFDDLLSASYKILSNSNSTPVPYFLDILQRQKGFPNDIIVNESVSIPLASTSTSKSTVIAFAYVFFIEAKQLNWTDAKLCSTFDSQPVLHTPLRNAMIVRKGSPLKEFFNHQIMLMGERGFSDRIRTKYMRDTETICLVPKNNVGENSPLGISDIVTAPIILVIGFSLSLTLFILEKFQFWC